LTFASPYSAGAAAQAALAGQSQLRRGGRDGRRAGQREEGGLDAYRHGRERQGRPYGFPAAKLDSGPLHDSHRARLRSRWPRRADVAAGKPAALDLKLKNDFRPAAQLSNGEWMASVPAPTTRKGFAAQLLGCHTLERIVALALYADAFMKTDPPRMQGY